MGVRIPRRGGALGLGDRDPGVTLMIKGSWGTAGPRTSGAAPSSLNVPGLSVPNFHSESLPQLTSDTRLCNRQPRASAHEKHGSKGVAQRLGGALSSRESRDSQSISGVAAQLPVFRLGGGHGATFFGRPESGFIRHQTPPPCRPSSTPTKSKSCT